MDNRTRRGIVPKRRALASIGALLPVPPRYLAEQLSTPCGEILLPDLPSAASRSPALDSSLGNDHVHRDVE
jgi:hypothetical protein